MKPLEWFRPPLAVLTLFIGLMTVCALVLGWLGWQVLVQDRAVEAQRRQEQTEIAADRAVAAIERAFAVSDAEVMVTVNGETRITPAGRLAYAPTQTESAPVRAEIFAEAESLEFGKQDRTKAADAYARLAESDSVQVRAEALVRLGRVLRRERKWQEALKAYASLAKLGAGLVAGMPADLVSRAARCSVLDESGDGAGARRESAALWVELTAGKWNIPKATLETYLKELEALLPERLLPAGWEERIAMAQAAEWAFGQQSANGRWGPESGFPHGPAYSIEQTKDGYLWIGTEKGLFRFDGMSFQQMQTATEGSLNHVLGLLADADGGLWIRLRHPAQTQLRYDGNLFRDTAGDPAFFQGSVTAMARARDGGNLFWVLNGEPRAIVAHGKNFETAAAPIGFSRSPVLAFAQTSNGDIWVGTRDAGLFRLAGGRTFAITEGLPDLKVNALVPIGNNHLWVGTDAGVVLWDGAKLTKAGVPRLLDSVQALAMTLDRDSNLWIGTNSHGLLRLNSQGVASRIEPNGALRDAVTALFEDREGNLWTASAAGLERLRDSPFVTYSLPEGLPSEANNPVFVDGGNRVWVPPVTGGAVWLKDGKREEFTSGGLNRDVVYSITGRNDEVWLGRQRGGLTQLRLAPDSIAAKTYTEADGLAQNSVYSVYQARDGSVWAGTLSGGVTKLSGGRFTTYTIANGLLSNSVTAILEGSDGTMWFATPAGVSELSKSNWRSFTAKDGLPSEDINCLLQDSTGVLWAGTAAGLAFRESRRFQVPAGALPSLRESVLGLAEDRFGSLWIATANHVLRVNREKLLRGTLAEGDLREYGLADGLRGVEGVKRSPSVVTDPAGRIWFSLNHGVSVVDPARLRNNSALAIVRVQSVLADGKPVSLSGGAAHVPGGRQRITFRYTGLSLSVPERVRFRYQLENFDHGWSEPLAGREAIYTNLSPGPYRFRVIASNPDGVWSSAEASIGIEVDPLFWQTSSFRACLALGFLAVWLALYRLRLHQMTRRLNVRFEERLAERTRIAQELHDTLLQGFLSASMQVHVAADRLPEDSQAKPPLTRALQLMRQVIEEGRNAVRGLRSSTTSSLDLEHAFSRIQEELVPDGRLNEKVEFRVIVDGQPRPLRPLLRDEVYRIGREALINAFRHARAKSIDLEINYSFSQLRIVVRDDGCGIDPQLLGKGRDGHWGLSGMRERADGIGSRLHVSSSAGAGTEVALSVPSHVAFQDHRNHALTWLSRRLRWRIPSQGPTNKMEDANERSTSDSRT